MKQLGYIVQHLDEDSLTPNGPGKRLFTTFEDALEHAKEIIQTWFEHNTESAEGPVEFYTITQKMVDDQHSAMVFRSACVFVWIEIVYA